MPPRDFPGGNFWLLIRKIEARKKGKKMEYVEKVRKKRKGKEENRRKDGAKFPPETFQQGRAKCPPETFQQGAGKVGNFWLLIGKIEARKKGKKMEYVEKVRKNRKGNEETEEKLGKRKGEDENLKM